jgi:hypothetical protein
MGQFRTKERKIMKAGTFSFLAILCAFVLIAGPVATVQAQDEFDEGDSFEESDTSEGGESDSSGGEVDEHIASTPAADTGEGLMLSKGTMQVGGMIGIEISAHKFDTVNADGDSVSDTAGGGIFTFSPDAGYFIINNLELVGGIGFSIPFGGAYDFYPKNIFFDVGARYFFGLSQLLSLYVGGSFGMNINIMEFTDDDGNTTKTTLPSILLTVPAGLLIALNRHIALDVGTKFIFDIGVGDNSGDFWLHIPIAYFGIQGFFSFSE